MNDRMPPLPAEAMSEAQKEAAAAFAGARGAAVFGPFAPLLRSPELMRHAQEMGKYLRYRSAIGRRLTELAILVTSREWSQDFEWSAHHPEALKAGLDPAIVEAIADARRPSAMAEDEAAVYDFSIELHRYRRVSDPTYGRVLVLFGEHGVVDLIGVNGYYSLLAMTMNAARTAAPADGERLRRFPD